MIKAVLSTSVAFALASFASAQVNIVNNLPGTWIDLSSTGTALNLGDDTEADIPTTVGNSLLAAGTARVGSNGGVRFAGTGLDLGWTNGPIPNTVPSGTAGCFDGHQTLLPFWDDIAPNLSGNVYWQEVGGTLIVQWANTGFFNSVDTCSFQVQVFSAGPIMAQFLYQDILQPAAGGGASATIGYQAGGVMNDLQYSLNTAVVVDGDVLSVILGGGSLGTNYCQAALNSTGQAGVMSASGSASVGMNNLVLEASGLPMNAFGFFVTSLQQGFVPMAGGSQGNLCLAGSIGRYVGAGQIQNTGATDMMSLAVNLTQHPTPNGLISVAAGETWNFQGWHRDSSGGSATSNFTDGLELTFVQ